MVNLSQGSPRQGKAREPLQAQGCVAATTIDYDRAAIPSLRLATIALRLERWDGWARALIPADVVFVVMCSFPSEAHHRSSSGNQAINQARAPHNSSHSSVVKLGTRCNLHARNGEVTYPTRGKLLPNLNYLLQVLLCVSPSRDLLYCPYLLHTLLNKKSVRPFIKGWLVSYCLRLVR